MFNINHLRNDDLKLFKLESKCKFTPKVMVAELPPLLVLTCTIFYSLTYMTYC